MIVEEMSDVALLRDYEDDVCLQFTTVYQGDNGASIKARDARIKVYREEILKRMKGGRWA